MNARARGFSLVELLIVTVMLTLVMGAVYRTLISQQQSSRHLSAIINTQQTNRTAAQFLAGEMRELGTRLARDITVATSTSIQFRALRKVGFVCAIGGSLDILYLGDPFVAADPVVVYADYGTQDQSDDSARVSTVSSATGPGGGSCAVPAGNPWANANKQSITLPGTALTGVGAGALIRSFELITYGTFTKGSDAVFGRQASGDTAVTLIGPLASGANGFLLEYFNAAGTAISTPITGATLATIARIRLTVRGQSKGAVTRTGTYSSPLVTEITLRGN